MFSLEPSLTRLTTSAGAAELGMLRAGFFRRRRMDGERVHAALELT